ncbi:hypothetical protein [Campylobacter upsaliensis]|uniref:TrbC/VirB2 family protein n=1 Tax=Campylobacter upsaliensis TaxID=28080 RepID=A0A381EIN3_CAMUP|nr:hypothetical protein [Campylobacter upsaliensis]MCR2101493.1 hypothetical protein [Campylobacter upsaliensis]SUX26790.1 Uncharacterised protein [Campylobacter upsaliensis]
MKKIKKILSLIFITTPLFLFAKGGNVLSTLEQDINTQITEAGSSVASIIQTFTMIIGILWLIVMLITAYLNMEMIKNHAKSLFGAGVLIGIIYGLASKFA